MGFRQEKVCALGQAATNSRLAAKVFAHFQEMTLEQMPANKSKQIGHAEG
jgi:hypothetical protein